MELRKYLEHIPLNASNQRPGSNTGQQTWAPWWWYLVAIVPANLIRTALMPDDAPIVAVVAVFIVATLCVIAAVTAVYRLTHKRGN
jgi:hypothetical protein